MINQKAFNAILNCLVVGVEKLSVITGSKPRNPHHLPWNVCYHSVFSLAQISLSEILPLSRKTLTTTKWWEHTRLFDRPGGRKYRSF